MINVIKEKELALIVQKLKKSAIKTECWDCECFQGFFAQLEIDQEEKLPEDIAALKVESSKMHSCLGCDSCPPADVYTRYLAERSGSRKIE